MSLETAGKWLMVVGLGLVLLGGLVWLLGRVWPGLSSFPGTIRLQTAGGVTCVIPLLASIVLSVILTILLNFAAKFLK